MTCNQCGHMQESGLFCSKCGTKMEPVTPVNEQQPVHVEQKEQATTTPIHNQTEKIKSFDLQKYISIGDHWKTIILALTPIALILFGIAWGVSLLLDTSFMARDLTYTVLAAGEFISSTHIATLVAHMSVTLWDVLLVGHGAPATGTLQLDGMRDIIVSWKIPVIIAPIITIVVIALIYHFVKKLRSIERDKLVPIWLLSSFAYAIVMTIALYFLAPTYEIGGVEYALSISVIKTILHTFVVGVIGIGIGLQVHTLLFTKETVNTSWIRALRPFGITLLIWVVIASVVHVGTWFFMHPGTVYTTPLVSPLSLWDVYKTDILFYLLLPTYFIGELLYALGATFHLTSSAITDALYIPQMKLHTWMGVDVQAGVQENSYADLIESSTRFTWGTIISLLIYIYAVCKVRVLELKDHVKQTLTIGLITLVVAYGTTLTFDMTGASKGIIGFSPIVTSVIVMIVTALIFVLKYVSVRALHKQEEKQNGGMADGNR